MKSIFIIMVVMLMLCIGSVSGWEIKSDKYVGDVIINGDGTGFIQVDGYGSAEFNWNNINENQYEAHYWFYTVPFTYNPITDTITSTATDAILVK